MPLPPLFVNVDDVYDAGDLSLALRDLVNEGVVNLAGGEGLVTQKAGGANYSVDVAALTNGAWVKGDDSPGAQGVYRVRSTSVTNLAIVANVSGSTRVDRIVARVYDAQFVGAQNKWTLEVVQGVPGAGTPALPNGALPLAIVSQPTGAASITNAMITDQRTLYSLIAQPSQLTKISDSGEIAVAQANFDFQSIPGTYISLLIDAYLRGTAAVADQTSKLTFNNDGGANYDYNDGSAGGVAQTFGALGRNPGTSAQANSFAAALGLIPHYAGTANFKMLTGTESHMKGSTGSDRMTTTLHTQWRSSAAINRVTLTPNAGNFAIGSRVALYGRGA